MASLTPHRDAVEKALAQHAAEVAALPPAVTVIDRINRDLGVAMANAAMRAFADAQDAGAKPTDFLPALSASIGGATASVAVSMAYGQEVAAAMIVTTTLLSAQKDALRGLSGDVESAFHTTYPRPEAGRA